MLSLPVYKVVSMEDVCREYLVDDDPFVYLKKHNVFTTPSSQNVIKTFPDAQQWIQELIAHELARSLVPERTLECRGAFTDAADVFAIVYERAGIVPADEFDMRIEEALHVLETFNAHGLYHVDPKSANFLLRADNKLCLHDWGLAVWMGFRDVPGDLRYDRPPEHEIRAVMRHTNLGFEEAARTLAIRCQLRLVLAGNHELDESAGPDFFCGVRILPEHVGNHDAMYIYTTPPWFANMYRDVYFLGHHKISLFADQFIKSMDNK